jgi:hypothetical protein
MASPQVLRVTAADLLNRGLPQPVVTAATEVGESVFSGSGVLEAFKNVSRDLATDSVSASLVAAIGRFQTPLEAATYFIGAKYTELGGAAAFLGSPTTSVTACPDGEGFFRHFAGGSIYWHPAVGAHEVHGVIRNKWSSLGWERSFLGYPTSDETQGADLNHSGRFNHFQGGSIYFFPGGNLSIAVPAATSARTLAVATPLASASPAISMAVVSAPAIVDSARLVSIDSSRFQAITSAISLGGGDPHEVHGAIRGKYLALGAETSILGYPTTDETGTPDGIGRYNHFQAGSIYWTPNTGANEVHGLIREFWAKQGWERNPNLGYPISDELIPDRRIGHRRPETRRKPILDLPLDVVKLPAEALDLGFDRAVVNTPLTAKTGLSRASISTAALVPDATLNRSAATVSTTSTTTPARSTVATTDVVLNPVLGSLTAAASTAAPEASRNRFGDFENGVVFWARGDTAAKQLSPWMAAADGASMHLAANDVLAAAGPKIQAVAGRLSGVSAPTLAFAGTTSYSFDGLGARNRRHRILLTAIGTRMVSALVTISVPTPVMFEVQVEVCFEPEQRSVRAFFADWVPVSIPSDLTADPPLIRQLHEALDPLLWTSFDLLQIEDTNAGAPIAVLAVKTMANGDVNIYIEP